MSEIVSSISGELMAQKEARIVNWIIKWTLSNLKHLDSTDTYLIEKATADCYSELLQRHQTGGD